MRLTQARVFAFLRRETTIRFLQFGAVGVAGAVVNLSMTYLLNNLWVHYLLAGAIAIESALLFNFCLNRLVTFSDIEVAGVVDLLRALCRDHGVRLTGMVINLVILWVLTDMFGVYYLLSQAIGAGVAALWNFAGNLLWTWSV
jgi:dolichol-phosphate mannosyltransferase